MVVVRVTCSRRVGRGKVDFRKYCMRERTFGSTITLTVTFFEYREKRPVFMMINCTCTVLDWTGLDWKVFFFFFFGGFRSFRPPPLLCPVGGVFFLLLGSLIEDGLLYCMVEWVNDEWWNGCEWLNGCEGLDGE